MEPETPNIAQASQHEKRAKGALEEDDSLWDTDSEIDENLKGEGAEFLDPDLDDEDAEWISQQRQGRKSDAILSCPCCMTTCCIDCQQHADRAEQYRAMFVMNCRINFDESIATELEAPPNRSKRKRSGDKFDVQNGLPHDSGESVHPVYCSICALHLGFFDSDEIYHFMQVLATEA